MEYNFNEIGERIRQLRKAKGWSQEDFIEKIDTPLARNTLSAIENGDGNRLTLHFLMQACKLFECDVGYLLGEYTDAKTYDVQYIHDQTGLTMDAICKLQRIKTEVAEYSDVLSAFIEDGNFEYFLYLLNKRFFYSSSEKDVKPVVKKVNGEYHIVNAKEFHKSVDETEIQIDLDGGQILAKKKNLVDSLISSALTDRMQVMAEAYQKIQRKEVPHNAQT